MQFNTSCKDYDSINQHSHQSTRTTGPQGGGANHDHAQEQKYIHSLPIMNSNMLTRFYRSVLALRSSPDGLQHKLPRDALPRRAGVQVGPPAALLPEQRLPLGVVGGPLSGVAQGLLHVPFKEDR